MKALICDVETTGLVENRSLGLDRQPEVIEFCGILCDLRTGKRLAERDLLIKPLNPLSSIPTKKKGKTITQITGITNEMLLHAPPFSKVADDLFSFVEKAPVFIAHNASFEKDMLELEAERLKRKIKWPAILCTVEQSISVKGIRLNLTALHELLFDEPFSGAHRARADVEALMRCCIEMFARGWL